MPKYLVIRTFPSQMPISRNQVYTDPNWKNASQLLRSGYIREVSDDFQAEVPAIGAPMEVEPVIEPTSGQAIEQPIETITDALVQQPVAEPDLPTEAVTEAAAGESSVQAPVKEKVTVQNKNQVNKTKEKKKGGK